MRVLLIDDDVKIFEHLELWFDRAGHTLKLLGDLKNETSLRQALDSFRPTGIVLDYEMPFIRGKDCYQWIRNWSTEIPVVLYSKYAEEPDILSLFRDVERSRFGTLAKSNALRDASKLILLLDRLRSAKAIS